MRSIFLSYIFLLIAGSSFSQNTLKIDSLEQELKHAKNRAEILINLAEVYLQSSPTKAIEYSEKAYEAAIENNDKLQIGESFWYRARAYLIISDYETSNRYTDSARIYYGETKNSEKQINCDVMKASTLMLQGKYDDALILYNESLIRATELDAKDIIASILMNRGRIIRVRGDYAAAQEDFSRALHIATEINNNYLLANAYHLLGIVYQDQQFFESAVENYLKALPIMEELNLYTQIPYLYVSLGSALRDSKNYHESLKYYHSAMVHYVDIHDKWGLYELNRHLGLTHMEMNNLDSAWIYFQNSLKYSKEINEAAGECNTMNYLGEILISRHDYEQALEYLNSALKLNTTVDNDYMLVNIQYNRGRCYVYMGKLARGLNILTKSLDLAESLNLKYERMIVNKEMSSAYTKLKNYKKALEHFELYSELNDSIYREESHRHFVEMEQKYQSEKRNQEISQLKLDRIEQDTAIRKQRFVRNIFILGFLFASILGFLFYRSYKARKKADNEKEALLKEIHHRVKNNLQIVSSLLSIQSDNVTDSKVISAVQESQSRVKAMALIHQLLYQDKNLSKIDFSSYLPQLVNTISSIFKKDEADITTKIHVSDISFDIDTAIPVGLIVTELVSNSYKYAFDDREKGEINIHLKPAENNQFLLTIKDSGKGLPPGINIEELNSMGLRLVNILTRQLDGKLSYTNNHGVEFSLIFTETT